ncbi:MAG: alpha-glucoside transport system permease protein [Frankiales bacterium]|nr:alpha-glucoside transport system permease protein [Frankiales bacterium]
MSTPVAGVAVVPPEERIPVTPKEPRKKLTSRWASLVVVVVTILWTIPTFGLAITSLRPKKDVTNSGWWEFFFHPHLTLNNYHDVIAGTSTSNASIAPYFINSIAITIPATLIPLALGSMAAYALAWVKFRGSTVLFFFIFALQIVPLQLALVPLLQLFSHGVHIGSQSILPLAFTWTTHSGAVTQLHKLTLIPYHGLGGSFYPVWIAHTMFGLPLVIFLLHNFMSQLPGDLIEAAQVDGASQFTIFRKIIIPLSTPALASVLIFQFLWVWNDLLVALVFTDGTPDHSPITARLVQLAGSLGSSQELLTAGAFIAIVVPLIVFFSLQRFFVRGLLAGSVKS